MSDLNDLLERTDLDIEKSRFIQELKSTAYRLDFAIKAAELRPDFSNLAGPVNIANEAIEKLWSYLNSWISYRKEKVK